MGIGGAGETRKKRGEGTIESSQYQLRTQAKFYERDPILATSFELQIKNYQLSQDYWNRAIRIYFIKVVFV